MSNRFAPAGTLAAPTARVDTMTFRQRLETTDRFVIVGELVTSRGLVSGAGGRRILGLARALAAHSRFDALSITDNPGGHAMLSADTLGTDLASRGQEVIVHLSCKDWNRNALESRAWKLASEGFYNVLALSGDYPASGHGGRAAPVFDIDSVGLLEMFSRTANAPFFLGAVVNSHKRYERELMPQYFKLARKIASGARFIINQIGYNARKEDELLRYMRLQGLDVPTLANVYVLSRSAAQYFHRGGVPGCVITKDLMDVVERQSASPDRGAAFFLELAAKQCAIAKGLGFRGVYLGGRLAFHDYERLLEIWDSFGPDDWRMFVHDVHFEQPGEYYCFSPDPTTGLNSDELNTTGDGTSALRMSDALAYTMNSFIHRHAFEPGSAGFRIGRVFYAALESRPRLKRALHGVEYAVKNMTFGCKDCGDCSLPDVAFMCPESDCAKNQRNGPCGGTRDGLCEVSDKECIWARAYDRMKAVGRERSLLDHAPVFRDGSLNSTSAWGNAFLERDHHGKKRREEL